MSNTHTASSHTASQQRANERKRSRQTSADEDRIINLLPAVLQKRHIVCPNKNCKARLTAGTVEAQIKEGNIVQIVCELCKPQFKFKHTKGFKTGGRTYVCLGCGRHNKRPDHVRRYCSCNEESHDSPNLDGDVNCVDVNFEDCMVTESETVGNVISPPASEPVDSDVNMDQDDEADKEDDSSAPPLRPRSKRNDCDSMASSDEEDEDFGDGVGVGGSGGDQGEEMQFYWDEIDADDSVNENVVEDGSLHSLGGGINVLMMDDNSVNYDDGSDENLRIIENRWNIPLAEGNPNDVDDAGGNIPLAEGNPDDVDAGWNIPLAEGNPFYLLEDGKTFDARRYFNIQNGYPLRSALYFTKQHEKKDGRKDIVMRCFFDRKHQPFDNMILDSDVDTVFHEAARYYNLPYNERPEVVSMVCSARSKVRDERDLEGRCYEEAFRSLIENWCPFRDDEENKVKWLDEQVKEFVDRKNKNYAEANRGHLDLSNAEQEKDIRARFTEGPRSIVKLLPTPDVKVVSLEDDKKVEYAHIDVEQLIMHMLAYDHHETYYYRAGHDDDWEPATYPNDPLRGIFLRSERCKEVHRRVKKMVDENEIDPNTRIAFIRPWSDGFGAHAITANNEYNNIQVFTIRLKGDKDFILPHALLFKKNNSRSLIVKLIEELKGLEKPKVRYWAREKAAFPTMIFTDLFSNDLPERCYNTGHSSQSGKYAKRWAHSCIFIDDKTPTCDNCKKARIELIINKHCDSKDIRCCGICNDWWSDNIEDFKEYPIEPGFHILDYEDCDFPSVSLSFELMRNSLNKLDAWYREHKSKERAKDVVKKYLQLICVGYNTQLAPEFDNTDIEHISESKYYPPLIREHERLSVEMWMFPSVVMHLFFLGIMKRIIKEANRLKVRDFRSRVVRAWYEGFITLICQQQIKIKNLSVEWCNPMSFSAKQTDREEVVIEPNDLFEEEEQMKQKKSFLATVGWMSSHQMSFARICLFQFSKLDSNMRAKPPQGFDAVIQAFRRLIVVFFCLVANSFGGDEAMSPLRIGHLVRLFLTYCREYHQVARKEKTETPFYESTSNFFSLLNCINLIKMFGSLRYLWEGLDEQFIKCLKREIGALRHNTSSLKNLLEKLLTTMVLRDLNRHNPLQKNSARSRNSDFKVYRCKDEEEAVKILESNQFMSGIVDEKGDLYVCFCIDNQYALLPLKFESQGKWLLNLWYSKVTFCNEVWKFKEKSGVVDIAADYFILLKQSKDEDETIEGLATVNEDETIEGLATVICKSWKVRMDDGTLRLPMPREEYLK